MPNFGRQGIDPPKRDLSNPLPELYPQGDLPQGWGLTFFLHQHPGPTGRSGSTGWFVFLFFKTDRLLMCGQVGGSPQSVLVVSRSFSTTCVERSRRLSPNRHKSKITGAMMTSPPQTCCPPLWLCIVLKYAYVSIPGATVRTALEES